MYVIRHQTTHTFFGINKADNKKTKICCFPNVNDAKRVADNIARFHYCQNKFPDLENYKEMFVNYKEIEYDNNFTPFKSQVDYEDSLISLDHVASTEFIEYCANANLDVMFCILSEKMDYRFYMFDMSLNQKVNEEEFLNKCYEIN